MKTATTTGDLYEYGKTPAEAVECLSKTGFKNLDFSFYTFHKGNSPYLLDSDKEWKQQIEDARAAADANNMRFVQAHAPGYNPAGNLDHARCMRAMHRSIEACAMLDIPCTVLHTAFMLELRYPEDKDAYFKYNRKYLEELLATAEKFNVTLCVENSSKINSSNSYFFMTADDMLDFIAYMDHPLLGCCWDTGHAVMEGKFDQYSDLTKLGKNLKAIHLHDNNGTADEHLPPYSGKLQLDTVVQALKDIQYQGAFTFEVDNFMAKCNGSGVLRQLPLELRIDTLQMLYKLGKHLLQSYDSFEE